MKPKQMARTVTKFMLTLLIATAPFFAGHSAEAHIFLNRYDGDTVTVVYHMPGNEGVYYDITYGNCTGIVGKPGDFQLEVRVPLREVQLQDCRPIYLMPPNTFCRPIADNKCSCQIMVTTNAHDMAVLWLDGNTLKVDVNNALSQSDCKHVKWF